jgi:hypothetical protein
MKKIFIGLRTLGVLVLVLVTISNIRTISTVETSNIITSVTVSMSFAVCIGIVLSTHQLIHKNDFNVLRVIYGVIIMTLGGIVVYLLPSYFHSYFDLPINFWKKVSLFSLPAICIEGGLFTLYTELEHIRLKLLKREHRIVNIAFIIYTISAITTNFLVLNSVWPINEQLLFYRTLIAILTFVTLVLILKRFFPKTSTS